MSTNDTLITESLAYDQNGIILRSIGRGSCPRLQSFEIITPNEKVCIDNIVDIRGVFNHLIKYMLKENPEIMKSYIRYIEERIIE